MRRTRGGGVSLGRRSISFGNRSLTALGVALIAIQNFYPIVNLALRHGQTGAGLMVLFSTGFTILLTWPVAAAMQRMPGGTFFDLSVRAVGRWPTVVYGLALVGGICFTGGLVLREVSEMALSANFPHTPQTFATTTVLVVAAYVASADSDAVVRLGRLLLTPLVLGLVLVVVGSAGWGTPGYLLPVLGPGLRQLMVRSPLVATYFAPIGLLFWLADGLRDRRQLTRTALLTLLASGAALAVVTVTMLLVFAFPYGINIAFPLHEATRLVIGGRFFERMDAVWLFVWVSLTILHLAAVLHGGALIFMRSFRLPRHGLAVAPLSAAILTIAFFTRDQPQTILWHEYSAWLTVLLSLVIPALLAAVASARRRLT